MMLYLYAGWLIPQNDPFSSSPSDVFLYASPLPLSDLGRVNSIDDHHEHSSNAQTAGLLGGLNGSSSSVPSFSADILMDLDDMDNSFSPYIGVPVGSTNAGDHGNINHDGDGFEYIERNPSRRHLPVNRVRALWRWRIEMVSCICLAIIYCTVIVFKSAVNDTLFILDLLYEPLSAITFSLNCLVLYFESDLGLLTIGPIRLGWIIVMINSLMQMMTAHDPTSTMYMYGPAVLFHLCLMLAAVLPPLIRAHRAEAQLSPMSSRNQDDPASHDRIFTTGESQIMRLIQSTRAVRRRAHASFDEDDPYMFAEQDVHDNALSARFVDAFGAATNAEALLPPGEDYYEHERELGHITTEFRSPPRRKYSEAGEAAWAAFVTAGSSMENSYQGSSSVLAAATDNHGPDGEFQQTDDERIVSNPASHTVWLPPLPDHPWLLSVRIAPVTAVNTGVFVLPCYEFHVSYVFAGDSTTRSKPLDPLEYTLKRSWDDMQRFHHTLQEYIILRKRGLERRRANATSSHQAQHLSDLIHADSVLPALPPQRLHNVPGELEQARSYIIRFMRDMFRKTFVRHRILADFLDIPSDYPRWTAPIDLHLLVDDDAKRFGSNTSNNDAGSASNTVTNVSEYAHSQSPTNLSSSMHQRSGVGDLSPRARALIREHDRKEREQASRQNATQQCVAEILADDGVHIRVPSWRTVENNGASGSSFTVFLIEVTHGPNEQEQILEKRFSQFVKLHEKLLAQFSYGILPELPPKRWLAPSSPEALCEQNDSRCVQLEKYLSKLVSSDFRRAEVFANFFNMDEFTPHTASDRFDIVIPFFRETPAVDEVDHVEDELSTEDSAAAVGTNTPTNNTHTDDDHDGSSSSDKIIRYRIVAIDRITGAEYIADRRFSEFERLHQSMELLISTEAMPPLPAKVVVFASAESVAESRRIAFENVIRVLCRTRGNYGDLLRFIGVPSSTNESDK
jgi:PX domain